MAFRWRADSGLILRAYWESTKLNLLLCSSHTTKTNFQVVAQMFFLTFRVCALILYSTHLYIFLIKCVKLDFQNITSEYMVSGVLNRL